MSDETKELAVVTEEDGQIATFEQLVTDDKLKEAVELADTFANRLSSEEDTWRKRSRKANGILQKRKSIAEREQKWDEYDERVELLKLLHPEFYERMEEEHGRDLQSQLVDWDCRGDELHACLSIVVRTTYRGEPYAKFCDFFTDEVEDFDAHRFRNKHLDDDERAAILDAYPTFEVSQWGNSAVHRVGHTHVHENAVTFTLIRIGDYLYSPNGRMHRPDDLCRVCWKIGDGSCGLCNGPLTKKDEKCVLECA